MKIPLAGVELIRVLLSSEMFSVDPAIKREEEEERKRKWARVLGRFEISKGAPFERQRRTETERGRDSFWNERCTPSRK